MTDDQFDGWADKLTFYGSGISTLWAQATARARGGARFDVEPPAGYSARDVADHLRRYGIASWGWYEFAPGVWRVHVAEADADRAEIILGGVR